LTLNKLTPGSASLASSGASGSLNGRRPDGGVRRAAREVIAKLETRELSVGIGVATGSAYVGDIQSADRRI